MVRQDAQPACGAAVLTAALAYWDRPVSKEEVLEACPVKDEGIQAKALRTFARGKGMECFIVRGEPGDLEYELAKGRPVVVGTRKGRLTHYELVVGLRPGRQVVTLDPARGWRRESWTRFLEEWTAAARTTMVLFPPDSATIRE